VKLNVYNECKSGEHCSSSNIKLPQVTGKLRSIYDIYYSFKKLSSKRKANWIVHILGRSCRLKQVIEGKIKGGIVTERRGKKRRKLLDDLKERRGYSHLKEEALDRTMWRARFERGFGPVVRQTNK
jgi:hypothetical protein